MKKLFLPVTAEAFRKRWAESGLRVTQLAERSGYRNLTKGANRIQRFFERGEIHEKLFEKLAAALGFDEVTLRRLQDEDYEAWCAWADEPIQPHLILRVMAAVYCRRELPDEISNREAAEAYAAAYSAEQHKLVALVWSRRTTVYYSDDGKRRWVIESKPGLPGSPYSQVGGKRFVFTSGGIVPSE